MGRGPEPNLTPVGRLKKQRAARTGWRNTRDRTARTQPGRDALLEKFANEADPRHEWSAAERRAAGEEGWRVHMLRMTELAAAKRQAAREAKAKQNGNGEADATKAPLTNGAPVLTNADHRSGSDGRAAEA